MTRPLSERPLSDLHRHLDGSMRAATLHQLLARKGSPVPAELEFHAGMGLEAALSRFELTLSVLGTPEAVTRVTSEICEDAASDGVGTLEIRFAPQLHLAEGARVEEIVDAALEGAAGRAGLIFCGLYGEAPSVLEGLVEVAAARMQAGVVGIDLAGGPQPGHSFALESYARAFRRAADLGLGRTVHAGEGRPPAEIAVAVETLLAQRIGHGVTLLEDGAVVDLVLARGVTIEACPTSNVHTGVIPEVAAHPLPRWLALGIKVCVNTDNTLFSGVSSSEEHARARRIPGMDDALMARVIENGHAAAFARGQRTAAR